ncbi:MULTISPECIES: type II toxin-antitoxin system RelE family toxin [Pectobacterium]|uniref:Type II toxin-antitoxin system RelE/ParE family toxin n=1 Tax=Pectobacterium versatile TaxID=2488639 RepID=A0AAW3RZN7_9GAMM|nr:MULTISPECIES: type II toxin-antitoxin system RelE/ParE family toxin [Pectobacterium]ASN87012.1 RelE-like toxin of type II toxin-antitoxin system [Pectobacterium versatile]KHT31895.1 RelE toxin [Pectobacterium carotovorum subsp. carotovorum]MBA0161520.1 type II toxin-antitoxin system RelE/ParE family toxin [Pectobacterium versatile]MBA0169795.1 type II toxin-antitoxin system RelE/ParE family toxin [Pectobacterium versatile]MBD0847630.1 RelE toxin [Pectobacterium carotovorum subsp. carotovoru
MSYKLEFEEHALKEFKKLGAPVREQFTKKLKEVLQHPHVPANRLHGMADCYKIKLRSAGYRLVYQVLEHEIVVLVLAVGKRERSEVYKTAKDRL